jgi:Helix-turn-helix domain of resolvase
MTNRDLFREALIKLSSQPLTRGKPRKFTPERLQQIRNLVERGTSREEIADILKVSIGSLQVTCSKAGISLRRPKFANGAPLVEPMPIKNSINAHATADQHISVSSQSTEERFQGNSQSGATERVLAAKPKQEEVPETSSTRVAISIQYKGRERTAELPLTSDMIGQLAFEAALRNMRIGELIAELIVAVVKKDLLPAVLGRP